MNEKIKNLIKSPKALIILGAVGVLMIFVSSIIPSGDGEKTTVSKEQTYTSEQYQADLEKKIKDIVTGITGDKNPTVVVTLESGIRYSYASADETDLSSSTGEKSDQSSQSKKQSYITVKTADGGEQALIVTEFMPDVRGVAVICSGGNSEVTAEKIKNAVTAALNITSKRVYISGGTVQ